ncbi:MAG: phosphatidylglycerophosphatase A [Ignavibacteriales bacterium]|nr:phosphatidylglycerophosphatase A [Ignavibacteriales bacterium]
MPPPAESRNLAEVSPAVTHPSFFVKAFASGLFSGYAPFASGTVGSLVGLAIYFIPGFEHPYAIMPASFLVFLLGIKASEAMETHYGHDPAEVTIDEVLGMWMSLWLLPKSLAIAGIGFILFRIFDIIKPFPARKFDALKGGAGVMLDDLVAAAYTNIALHLLLVIPFTRDLLSSPQ